ncbi:MAG: hypothetical protein P8M03_06195 [Flavobacteriaceae bacterium]|nr:hypothetical protein [Flavobacteriaceae bacterium]
MKKGLLSLLAVLLTVVGCQNYDDQFSDLNTKIAALQQSIAGLATVGTDVAALKATVSGLGTAIAANGTKSDALSTGLATAQADLDTIEASLATVASAAELEAIKTSLSGVESDVKELLAANAVINQSITINSLATLQYAESLVSTDPTDPNVIVNGNVEVTVSDAFLLQAGVTIARINAVTNKLATVLGAATGGKMAISFTATATGNTGVELNNLTFVDCDFQTSGNIGPVYPKLATITGNASATSTGAVAMNNIAVTGAIQIGTGATSVDLTGSTAASIYTTGSAQGVLVLNSATKIDVGTALVTSLAAALATDIDLGYKTAGAIDLAITGAAKAATIDIAAVALDNFSIAGTVSTCIIHADSAASVDDISVSSSAQLHLPAATSIGTGTSAALVHDFTLLASSGGVLTISAATAFNAPAFSQTGSLTLTAAKTVNMVSATGMKSPSAGSQTLVMPAVENLTLTALAATASVVLDGDYATIKTANITGKAGVAPLDTNQLNGVKVVAGAAALTGLTVGGQLDKVYVTSPAATLVGITTAGGIKLVSISGAAGLTAATIGHDHVEGMLGAQFIFDNNDKVTALNADSLAEVKNLQINGNALLAAISFNAITDPDGSASTLTVSITDNALTAAMSAHVAATETEPAIAATITNSSGIFDLVSYLGNFVASSGAGTSSFEVEIDVVTYTAAGVTSTKTNAAAFTADAAAGNVTAGDDVSTAAEVALIGS